MLPHHLTRFGIQRYYQNESKFSGVYSRDNLIKRIEDGHMSWLLLQNSKKVSDGQSILLDKIKNCTPSQKF